MSEPPPFFSIVVPTYDRPKALTACLESLARLDYPRDRFEVIVVDDGSRSTLESVVDTVRDRLDVTLVRQPNRGPAAARNTGAARARGQHLAFTDDDCTPAADWLRNLAARFTDTPCPVLIGGRTVNRLPDNPYSTASQLLIDYLYAYFQSRRGRFFTSNNLAVPAEAFSRLGGFDETIPIAAAEDREFGCRWSHRGYPMLHAPEALVHHAHVLDFRRFWRQHFNYGRGAYYFRQLLLRDGAGELRLEPTSFYANLLRHPLAQGQSLRAYWIAMLLGVSQLANAIGFFFEKTHPKVATPRD